MKDSAINMPLRGNNGICPGFSRFSEYHLEATPSHHNGAKCLYTAEEGIEVTGQREYH